MILYAILIENELKQDVYTSIKAISYLYSVPYRSALSGKRLFLVNGKKVEIRELKLNKIKGRGK